MSTLMRAPRECGSWFWDLDEVAAPGLASALVVASKMTELLRRHELLTPHRLEYDWYVLDSGGVGITTSLALTVPLEDPRLPERVLSSRPAGYPDAEVDDVHVVGAGAWIDAEGKPHLEPRLVDLSVSPAPVGLSAEISVHHDIWGWFDFSGRPHPDVHQHNAPRLAAALQEINSMLGVKGEPGEVTYFGFATELGIGTPDALDDGSGPDVTDKL
ncbi:hypothetical protein PV963_13420 [Streptomyces coeruleorubidus]|uniref:hypothetical protein n=1 Tax=Streptomyces coeruleorubidus TaxID=116188 RepID=UPI00237EF320|nr:hypothetical protein [Streptomyces coeruleorubidus]WDV51304.1 hypothetical protein PV963_13420 [Streptomyces coeruleorubidus]